MATKDVVNAGDTSKRVGVEVIRARGVDVDKLIKMLIANGGAEFASTYYYTILRMHVIAGKCDIITRIILGQAARAERKSRLALFS